MGEQLMFGRGGSHHAYAPGSLFLVFADSIFFFPSLFDSLSQNKGRTAGFRKSPSTEPRAHTNPLTAQEKQLRSLTFCFSAWDENVRQMEKASILLEVRPRPVSDFRVFDLAKGREEIWVEFLCRLNQQV